ncbi:MAG: Nif3-like dinuclear metal center hexameric protein [Oscillospiraceae bacterium]
MPTVKQVVSFVEELAPAALAEEWDNVGLLVDCGADADKILVALDITHAVVQEARRLGCRLIVSHHPVIFHPLRRLGEEDVAFALVQAGISALCAHTNLDAAAGGVNDALAEKIGLTNLRELAPLGRVGTLPAPVSPEEFAAFCAGRLGAHVQLASAGGPVHRVAVIGGAGADYWPMAKQAGASCLLTGEAGHHDGLDAAAAGISLVAAGHYATEAPVVPALAGRLRGAFAGAEVLVSGQQKDPFVYFP